MRLSTRGQKSLLMNLRSCGRKPWSPVESLSPLHELLCRSRRSARLQEDECPRKKYKNCLVGKTADGVSPQKERPTQAEVKSKPVLSSDGRSRILRPRCTTGRSRARV